MRKYSFYDSKGEIVGWIEGNFFEQDVPVGASTYEGFADPQNHYIDVVTGLRLDRPSFPIVPSNLTLAVGEVLRIDGIPPDTLLEFPGDSIVVHDGYVEWSSAVPGEYQFKFINFPYKDEVIYASVS